MPKTSRLSPIRVREAFAKRLKQARESRFEHGAALAREIGVHPATYRRWVRGDVEPNLASLAKIIAATNVSAEFLIVGELPTASRREAK